jgi:thymidylate kinase
VIVFEGPDAAGKGGAIKRLTQNLDPRGYVVWPIGAPHGDDRERHYLYRFWRRLPEEGQIAIFDRSWYGRVLVERVEGYASPEAWARAYSEINQFERQLLDHGTTVIKLWIHISKEEQLRRFRERERIHYKSWKLTAEDWRNRGKWEDHRGPPTSRFSRRARTTRPRSSRRRQASRARVCAPSSALREPGERGPRLGGLARMRFRLRSSATDGCSYWAPPTLTRAPRAHAISLGEGLTVSRSGAKSGLRRGGGGAPSARFWPAARKPTHDVMPPGPCSPITQSVFGARRWSSPKRFARPGAEDPPNVRFRPD